jgi:uncharacterized protein YgiM (DUF1202 family)
MLRYYTIIGVTLVLTLLMVGIVQAQNNERVVATVAPDLLYLRESPSTGARILAELARGTRLLVQGIEINPNDDGRWVFVQVVGDKMTGWVRSDFITFPASFNRLSQLPVVSDKGSASGAVSTASTTSPTTITIAPATGGTVTVTGGIPAKTSDFANLRTGPELTFDVIRRLPTGTPITLVARNANGVWVQVVVGGDVGWIFYQLIDSDISLNTLPVAGSNDAPPAGVTITVTGGTGDGATVTTTTSSSAGNLPPLSVKPGTPASAGDGRLNAYDDLGYALVYCMDANGYTNAGTFAGGGIVVYFWNDSSIPLFASEAEIKATSNGQMVKQNGVFSLYIREEGGFLLNGIDQTGAAFTFVWDGCNVGRRAR